MPKIIFIAPQCQPLELTIDVNDYKVGQALVGGYLASGPLAEDLDVHYHDEGLLEGLPPNVLSNGMLLVGNLWVGRSDDEGDLIDTTETDMHLVRKWLADAERPGRFEYDIPAPRIFTSVQELREAGPLPTTTIVAIHDVRF